MTALHDTRLEELRNEEAQLKRTIGELMLQLMPRTHEKQSEAEHDFLHFARGRVPFVTSLKQFIQRTERSLTIWADPLFLARLRLYEDILLALAKLGRTAQLRILVPNNCVDVVNGRRIHADEVAPQVRIHGAPGADALIAVRDDVESLEVHFMPNDLHPSRGSDRVVTNRDPDIAAALGRMMAHAWETATAWSASPLQRT